MCIDHTHTHNHVSTDELSWTLLEGMVVSLALNPDMKRMYIPSSQRPNGKFGIIITEQDDEILQTVDMNNADVLLYDRITKEMIRMT